MKIKFTNGVRNGERIELAEGKFSIGRETDNDIVLETEGVSRHHAELLKKNDGKWYLKDLGSTNGCKVNSEKIDNEKTLKEGDSAVIGDQEFIVVKPSPGTPKQKPASAMIPIIQPVKKAEKEAGATGESGATGEVGKAEEKTKPEPAAVKKIVFQPMPKAPETVKAEKPEKEKEKKNIAVIDKKGHEPVIQTVTPKNEKTGFQTSAGTPTMTAKELSESADNIFGSQQQKKSNKPQNGERAPLMKKAVLNVLFYLSLLLAVVVFVFWFLSSNPEPRRQIVSGSQAGKKDALLLYYVKSKITKGNVFRFSLLVENEIATFTIDDLKSDRHSRKVIKNIKPEFMNMLINSIKSTGFMDLSSVSPGTVVNNLDETRQMTVALNNKSNSITIRNNSAPMSFEDIESAIQEFADGYDLITYAMSPKELKKRAEESFKVAEDYYANRNANSANLLAAERRYKITVDYLNQFTPKPKIWDIARKRQVEVEKMRKKRWNELTYEVERLERLDKIQDALEVLNEMKLLAPAGSKAEKWVRKRTIRLSEMLKTRNK